MAGHTPGPWKTELDARSRDYPVREAANGGGYLIATVWHDDSGNEGADARLIAAAPELLAACKIAVVAIAEAIDRPKGVVPDVAITARERLMAAIALASVAVPTP